MPRRFRCWRMQFVVCTSDSLLSSAGIPTGIQASTEVQASCRYTGILQVNRQPTDIQTAFIYRETGPLLKCYIPLPNAAQAHVFGTSSGNMSHLHAFSHFLQICCKHIAAGPPSAYPLTPQVTTSPPILHILYAEATILIHLLEASSRHNNVWPKQCEHILAAPCNWPET